MTKELICMINVEDKIIAHNEANKRYREKKLKEHPYKKCSRCGIEKPIEEFTYSKTEKRYKSKCKECRHESYLEQKEKTKERARKYYEDNKNKVLEKSRERRRNNLANEMLKSAKVRAKKKGLEFNIDETDITIPEYCPVLGIRLEIGNGRVQKNSPTLDRIDSNKGYIKGNVIVVSQRANTIKTNATIEEIFKVYEFYKKLIE